MMVKEGLDFFFFNSTGPFGDTCKPAMPILPFREKCFALSSSNPTLSTVFLIPLLLGPWAAASFKRKEALRLNCFHCALLMLTCAQPKVQF